MVLALVAVLALGGCSFLSGLVHTTNALQDAGFSNATVGFATNGRSAVTVQVDLRPGGGTVTVQASDAASVVWQNLPGRFDTLTVEVRGHGTAVFTHAGLAQRFGPRPSNLDGQTVAAEVSHQGAFVLFGVIGLIVVFLLAVLGMWLSVRRSRRKRQSERVNRMMATLPPEMWGLDGAGASAEWAAARRAPVLPGAPASPVSPAPVPPATPSPAAPLDLPSRPAPGPGSGPPDTAPPPPRPDLGAQPPP